MIALLALVLPILAQPPAPPPRWAVAADLLERLDDPATRNPAHANAVTATLGGRTLPALSQHPDGVGKPAVRIDFPDLRLPAVAPGERLVLRFALGIRDGFDPKTAPEADGVLFLVDLDDREIFRGTQTEQAWRDQSVDLTAHAGKTVTLAFRTDPRANSAYDWAVWGAPRVEIEGRPWLPPPIPSVGSLSLAALTQRPAPARIVATSLSSRTATVVATLDRGLDLAAQIADRAAAQPAPVPLAPEIVVGEGPDPRNHTVVRLLSRHGLPRLQFLAFPRTVRGGVGVAAGSAPAFGRFVAAAPLAHPAESTVRVFDRDGALRTVLHPTLTPPLRIACGDFVPSRPGDEIAVSGRGAQMEVFAADGRRLQRLALPLPGPETLAADRGVLIASYPKQGKAAVRTGGRFRVRPLPAKSRALWPSAFGAPVATGPEAATATITRTVADGAGSRVEVGARERRFWATWYGDGWGAVPDGRYTRKADFRHIRVDGAAARTHTPEHPASADAVATAIRTALGPTIAAYATARPAVWEPCFTHRWHKGTFQPWRDARDPETDLPRYVSLTRRNRPVEYGEFGNIDFYAGTYALDVPELDRLYVDPLRAFLRLLAPAFRKDPERLVALEPNHEHEIAVEADATLGDYNSQMIAGFYDYLAARHGPDVKQINRALGTAFDAFFDAPRNQDRGVWDAYSPENPFFAEWTAYNRYVVNRRLAQTFREALLAGFPPEAIKSHQIPDTYAIGNLSAFSQVTARFTPVDFALSAGTGYGFTRYGVWYNRPHEALTDAHRAGFDQMTIGEYQALTPDPEAAYRQLAFLRDHGTLFAHCMLWPAAHDKGFNATMDSALRRLFAEDKPRPTLHGVGGVRPDPARRFDIVCLGEGDDATGLLKSVRADGAWEGSVYVTPFHARVAVTDAPMVASGNGRWSSGPLRALDSGEQVEVTLRAATRRAASLTLRVRSQGVDLPGLTQRIALTPGERFVRLTLRCPLPTDGVEIVVDAPGVRVSEMAAVRSTERTPHLAQGNLDGEAHRGGITFDLWR